MIYISDEHKAILETGIELNAPILLVGETGTGKTTIINHYAKEKGKTLHRISVNGATTIEEIVGKFLAKKGTTYWQDGLLVEAMKKGDWVVFDEINAALPEILFVLHSLLDDDRKVTLVEKDNEVVRPHKDFRFFATMNPTDDYAGTKELNKAFENRFLAKIFIEPIEPAEELKLLESKGISRETAEYLVTIAKHARDLKREEKIYYFLSTRDLIHAGKLIDKGVLRTTTLKHSILSKMHHEDKVTLLEYLDANANIQIDLTTRDEKLKEAEEKIKELERTLASLQRELIEKEVKIKEEKAQSEILKDEIEKRAKELGQERKKKPAKQTDLMKKLSAEMVKLLKEKDELLKKISEYEQQNIQK